MNSHLQNVLLIVLLCFVGWSWSVVASKEVGTLSSYNFPEHTAPSSSSAVPRAAETLKSLSLVAAGLRRKKILVVEVDVYHVGLYLSRQKIDSFDHTPLTQAKDLVDRLVPAHDDEVVAIVLRFARQVPTSKVVDAIVESLRSFKPSSTSSPTSSEDYSTSVDTLSSLLLTSIGSKGMEQDEELSFTFYPQRRGGSEEIYDHAIEVAVRKVVAGTVQSSHVHLTRRLIEIYTDAEAAVAPQVPRFLLARFLKTPEL